MKLGIGVIFLGIIKAISKIINAILKLIAYILLYLGLWVPALYMLFWLFLWLGLDFNIKVLNMDTALFYIGLCISIACSITITTKNFLLKPIDKLSEYTRRKKAIARRAIIEKALKLKQKNPQKYQALYGDTHPYDVPDIKQSAPKSMRQPIKPLVYRSERNHDIIVHEYPDKFEVFTDANGALEYIETKPKNLRKG